MLLLERVEIPEEIKAPVAMKNIRPDSKTSEMKSAAEHKGLQGICEFVRAHGLEHTLAMLKDESTIAEEDGDIDLNEPFFRQHLRTYLR